MLAGKGHVVSRSGKTADALPAAPSARRRGRDLASSMPPGLGRSGYGDDYRPRQDLVAVAQRDLAAGTVLTMGGHHHSIDGVGAEVRPAAPLAADRPAPFYLVADRHARPRRQGRRRDPPRRCRDRRRFRTAGHAPAAGCAVRDARPPAPFDSAEAACRKRAAENQWSSDERDGDRLSPDHAPDPP